MNFNNYQTNSHKTAGYPAVRHPLIYPTLRRGCGEIGRDKLFVPFEGDQTLAIILSKALLLAEDKKITDQSIIRQLKK
jgi:hypothetical protein